MEKAVRRISPEVTFGTTPTMIPLMMGERQIGTVAVPFSADELDPLIAARHVEALLMKESLRGSGPIRDLVVDFSLPWGHSLKNRLAAIEAIRMSGTKIEAILGTQQGFLN